VTEDSAKPDPEIVLDLILAFRRSKTMFAAVKLGIFDRLGSGPKSSRALARTMKLNSDGLERLLDACVGLKLLNYNKSARVYENTPAASTYLRTESSCGITGYINFSNDVFWKLWGNLEDAIREGTNRWQQTYKLEGDDFWRGFFDSKERGRDFLMGMQGYGQITSPEVVKAFRLEDGKTLIDLGGGTGHLAIAACQRYPAMHATVFDIPDALPLAREIVGAADPKVASRIDFVEGDFFTDRPLPEGDIYVVARTLHDWPEEKVLTLMRKVHAALKHKPDGCFLIAEALLRRDKSGPDWAQMQDLNMLVCAAGRERTFEEYEKLLADAGFPKGCATWQHTNSPIDVIMAHTDRNRINSLNPLPERALKPVERRNWSMSFPDLAKMYYAFFENTRIGCVLSEMNGRLVLVNKVYANIHGRSVDETLRLSYKEFTPERYQADDQRQILELLKTGRVGPFDKHYFRKDQTLVPVRVTLELINVDGIDYIWSLVEEIGKGELMQGPPRVP
jgi:acetylserotonin N-methyltransferase